MDVFLACPSEGTAGTTAACLIDVFIRNRFSRHFLETLIKGHRPDVHILAMFWILEKLTFDRPKNKAQRSLIIAQTTMLCNCVFLQLIYTRLLGKALHFLTLAQVSSKPGVMGTGAARPQLSSTPRASSPVT